jgi:hypothetical protein
MNPRINQRELSDKLSISLSTIKRVMTGMIQAHVLTRKGGKRYGYWEIEAKEQMVLWASRYVLPGKWNYVSVPHTSRSLCTDQCAGMMAMSFHRLHDLLQFWDGAPL